MDGHDASPRSTVMARARLEIGFATTEQARVVWEAVSADDPGSVAGRVDGERLFVECGPVPAPSVRVTVDDLLACIQAALGGAHGEVEAAGGGG